MDVGFACAYLATPFARRLSGETLYGTADGGGALGYGTVFKLNTNGTGSITATCTPAQHSSGDRNR